MFDDEKINILIIDDMPEKLLSFQAVLEDLGQNLVCVQSGREGLRALLEQEFAVILLDVNMPEMDGFETARLIRQRKKAELTPIIFLTAFSDDQHIWQGYSLGAVDYILTPVVPDVLRAKVSVFVDLYRKTRQITRHARQEVELAHEQAARAAAEDAERRSQYLSHMSSALARSLDLHDTISTVLRSVVDVLCDSSMLVLVKSSDWLVVHGRFQDHEWIENSDTRQQLDDSIVTAVEKALTEETLQSIELLYESNSADRLGLYRYLLIIPLVARGHVLGALGLLRTAEPFTLDETQLAEEVASRDALALDNARLYHDVQEGDRRKEEFLAMLSHELRNPLGAISNAMALLTMHQQAPSVPVDTTVGMAHDVMQRQLAHMERLVGDLLDISRITRGKIRLSKSPLDLRDAVRRVLSAIEPAVHARGLSLESAICEEACIVHADSGRIEQVLNNLLNNAVKYSEPPGRVEVDVRHDGDDVVATVRDMGVGISSDMLQKIFELFVQGECSLDRSQGGLGIGLTLVKSLMEMHDGSVQAKSAGPGRGSEFSIRLPLINANLAALPPGEASGSTPDACHQVRRRILVVDDNRDILETFSLLLGHLGHDVQSALHASAAIELAKIFAPEVIFVDIGLPGMNGYELARELRTIPDLSKATLIAMTGYGQAEDRRRALDAGFDHHLVKPVRPEQLQELLAAAEAPLRTGS